MRIELGKLRSLVNEALPWDDTSDDERPTVKGSREPVSSADIERQEWDEVARVIDYLGEMLGLATAATRKQDDISAVMHLKNIATHARRAAELIDISGER